MNGKALFEAMGYVDERFIQEAETAALPKGAPVLRSIAAMAACLCLLLMGWQVLPIDRETASTESAGESTVPCEAELLPESVPPPQAEARAMVVYVEELTDGGFRGRVTEHVDTELFYVGMELTVIIAEDEGDKAEDLRAGMSVMVWFSAWDEAAKTVTADHIQEVKG